MTGPGPLAARIAVVLVLAGPAMAAAATELAHRGAVVIEARSGTVLHARGANRRAPPASLAKLMTVLLMLERAGEAAAAPWPVSRNAAAQPPTRLGLRSGSAIGARSVLDALLVASANDAAVVAAEALAGSEAAFVERMNAAAARLGLSRTRFANASGLPAPRQFTTARDMAVLARHLWQRFPGARGRFALTGMTFDGRWHGTHNPLLGSYRGAGGMKTGFTCRAGFNLVALAERGGRTLIAVVLGAPTRAARDALVRRLLDRGFATQAPPGAPSVDALASIPGQGAGEPVHASIIARPCLGSSAKGPSGWNIDVGVQRSAREARALAREFIRARRRLLRGARAFSIPRHIGVTLHRAIVTGLDEERAREACLAFRDAGGACVIFGPEAADQQLEQAARIAVLAERAKARGGAPATRAP